MFNAASSLGLAIALGLAAWRFDSQLAVAQAGDSALDIVAGAAMVLATIVAARPRDEGHPYGHGRAEPLAALLVAMLAAVLALEVGQGALQALLTGTHPTPHRLLTGVFCLKIVTKGLVLFFSRRDSPSPSTAALAVDARNDVGVGILALSGIIAEQSGLTGIDSWLALPLAVGIAWSGIQLGRENLALLMGASPPRERLDALLALARRQAGVVDVHELRAQYLGTEIQVHLHVAVDGRLSVTEAHDIGERVRHALEDEDDVGETHIHLDAAPPVVTSQPAP